MKYAALLASAILLSSCRASNEPQIAFCRAEAEKQIPIMLNTQDLMKTYSKEQAREDVTYKCVEKGGWQFHPASKGCVSSSDMTRQTACYRRNNIISQAKRWFAHFKSKFGKDSLD